MKSGMKKLVVLLGLAVALSLVFTGAAFANFGPHGGYTTDTDACAGCHRAHSSFSTLHFEERVNNVAVNTYSLLVGNPGTMTEFCNACHGDAAPGASTNVVAGRFDSGPSASGAGAVVGADNDGDGINDLYLTSSTFGAGLNGGGFSSTWDPDTLGFVASTSSHDMDSSQQLWGAGAAPTAYTLTCTGCHDPHGSTNFRLLKDTVNSVNVASNVFSYEPTYPDRTAYPNGWVRYPNPDAITQMAAYSPNYTGGTTIEHKAGGSVSDWCSACHSAYNDNSSVYDYTTTGGLVEGDDSVVAAGVGSQTRHRHPVNIPLTAGDAIIQIDALAGGVADARIPLEVDPAATSVRENYLGCMTCHTAHGSAADMNGWASSQLVRNAANTRWVPELTPTNLQGGVMGAAVPAGSSLLRTDNRGVCQRCHGK